MANNQKAGLGFLPFLFFCKTFLNLFYANFTQNPQPLQIPMPGGHKIITNN